jgi:uncharacterized protein
MEEFIMSLEIKNCPKCKKTFVKIKEPICPECFKEEEAIFEKTRNFIKENPKVSLDVVSLELDISVKKIQKYIKEGRIDVSESEGITMKCDSCGKNINSGRYCDKCAQIMQNRVYDFLKNEREVKKLTPKKERTGGMHTRKNL